ncbi:unnamed protein product [Orchesella dallaii]|uniref:Alanine--glyoxylate aminotransferase 2-like n=1 Tax=Orchesella dallaii TaxID=48710 RepID=A0ABP1S224_9HEXA
MEGLVMLEDLTGPHFGIGLSREQTLDLRAEYIPNSCKLHFEKAPMKVVRATGQYIYDDGGTEFLDCVNCVAHVGHCNPSVIDAAKTSMLKMGNISIGMSDTASEYVSKLKVTFPPEIDTFLFVSSGSEANDVAIQLARLHSGGQDVVTVERAYHGGLSITNNVSPKQFENGVKCPDWVHVVSCPDLYNGKYRETDAHAVDKYCKNARDVMEGAVKQERKLACFISEPVMTAAGVIVPPSKWMHSVYKDIRSFGGVAIADEAQSGLGRCGTFMWSFQAHDNLIPDIITIGKPLGNGHPMACVATRSSIAAKLGNDTLGYYACDLVSAAIGLAVLNTVRSLSLQLNARTVGEFLREGIKALGQQHQNIGQVRGVGLMIGVEIVYGQQNRKPAREIAEKISYKMREHYVIIANDGVHKNVLMITPPMCFTCENAHRVIVALDKVLQEVERAPLEEHESLTLPFNSTRLLLSVDEILNGTEVSSNNSTSERNNVESFIHSNSSRFLEDEVDDDGGYATSNSFASMD